MKKIITLCILGLLTSAAALAVPANPRPFAYVQPNGDTLMIRLIGDEHFHFNTTIDGILVTKNAKDYYVYAQWESVKLDDGRERFIAKPTHRKARNADKRRRCEKRWVERHASKGGPKK